mmetsp:Transcript_89728/g.231641  ORF Transcript_89728/g.231641 Transcript_89728/m.231641 type:complete len:210 (-) Transcript_89728:928-1557(-)
MPRASATESARSKLKPHRFKTSCVCSWSLKLLATELGPWPGGGCTIRTLGLQKASYFSFAVKPRPPPDPQPSFDGFSLMIIWPLANISSHGTDLTPYLVASGFSRLVVEWTPPDSDIWATQNCTRSPMPFAFSSAFAPSETTLACEHELFADFVAHSAVTSTTSSTDWLSVEDTSSCSCLTATSLREAGVVQFGCSSKAGLPTCGRGKA